jgi:hypothetical protein
MGVCEVVEQMASAVAGARQPLSPREACWVYLLRGAVHYRDLRRLDLWENACNAVCSAVSPPVPMTATEELLEEVQMLGLCNLYQAFQEERTRSYYERLIPFFEERGVRIPASPDLSAW